MSKRTMTTEASENAISTRAQWQPIETAPKDGTRILLWIRKINHVGIGSYEVNTHTRHGKETYRREYWHIDFLLLPKEDPDPTHWMPLPAPPDARVTDAEVQHSQASHEPSHEPSNE